MLVLPDMESKFIIETDVSNTTIGGVLKQFNKEKQKEVVVKFTSRMLRKAEMNYSTTDKEALTIVFAVEKFRQYLFNRFEIKPIINH